MVFFKDSWRFWLVEAPSEPAPSAALCCSADVGLSLRESLMLEERSITGFQDSCKNIFRWFNQQNTLSHLSLVKKKAEGVLDGTVSELCAFFSVQEHLAKWKFTVKIFQFMQQNTFSHLRAEGGSWWNCLRTVCYRQTAKSFFSAQEHLAKWNLQSRYFNSSSLHTTLPSL